MTPLTGFAGPVDLQGVEAVTLDVHGTMIHSPRLGEIYTEVLSRHGLAVEREDVIGILSLVRQEFYCARPAGEDRYGSHPDGSRGWWFRFIDRVCRHLELPPPSRFAKAELFDRFTRAEAWEIFPEVPGVLAALADRGFRLGVISNWDDRLPVLLERLGLADAFEVIVFSADVGLEKPAPGIFHAALDRLGSRPESVLHVGDRPIEDVEGARAVGMRTLLVDRSGKSGGVSDLTPLG